MQRSSIFTHVQNQIERPLYSMKKKSLSPGESLSAINDSSEEKVLFIIDNPEVLYVPREAEPFHFDQKTDVYELIIKDRGFTLFQNDNNLNSQNTASPFYLTGDACFYNFLARRMTIKEPITLFNKKGIDIIWTLNGRIRIQSGDEHIEPDPFTVIVVEKSPVSYQIAGYGEIFFLKL